MKRPDLHRKVMFSTLILWGGGGGQIPNISIFARNFMKMCRSIQKSHAWKPQPLGVGWSSISKNIFLLGITLNIQILIKNHLSNPTSWAGVEAKLLNYTKKLCF